MSSVERAVAGQIDRNAGATRSAPTLGAMSQISLLTGLLFSSLLTLRFGALTLGDIALFAGLAIFALSNAALLSTIRVPLVFFLATLTVVVGGLVSSIQSQSLIASMAVTGRVVLVSSAVCVLLPWALSSSELLRRGLAAYSFGGAICGSGTLIQYFFGESAIPGATVTGAGRYTGFAQHVSDLGGVTCTSLVIGVGLLATSRSAYGRILHLLWCLLSAIGLILSGSVSGMVAAFIGILALMVFGRVRASYIVLSLVGMALALRFTGSIRTAVGALSPEERLLQALGATEGGRYATVDFRMDTYVKALSAIGDNPFVGQGMDPASSFVDRFPAHNFLIASAFQGGVLVAGGLVAIVYAAIYGWFRSRGWRSSLGIVCLCGAIAALVFSMTAPSLYNRYFWLPIAFLFCANRLLVARRGDKQDKLPDRQALG